MIYIACVEDTLDEEDGAFILDTAESMEEAIWKFQLLSVKGAIIRYSEDNNEWQIMYIDTEWV